MTKRRGRRSRDERRKQGAIIALAVVVGTVAGFAITPTRVARRPRFTNKAPVVRVAPARTVLLGHSRRDRSVDFLALVGIPSGGRHATVLFLPPPTVVQVPSLDLQALGDVARLSSATLLRTTVMNALGVRVDTVALIDDAEFAKLLAASGPLKVDFSRSLRVDDARGSLGFGAGEVKLTASDARRVLFGHEAEGSISHLVTVQDVLKAWFARLREPQVAARAAAASPRSGSQVVSIARSATRYETLPVQTVDAGGSERFQLRDAEAAALVRRDFPYARLGGVARTRVEILNGVGEVGVTPRVAAMLVPRGANIALTSNVPGFGVGTTHVVYYHDQDEPTARYYAQILGVGRIAKGDTPISVVDVTVVVGSDFVRLHPKK